jgi:hypothetical protein
LAKEWETEAKRRRMTQGAPPRKPTIRVRAGGAEQAVGLLSQAEVAAVLRISTRAVREAERRAFDKLRRALRGFWREYQTGEVAEAALSTPSAWALSPSEVVAVYALAQTPFEQRALRKLLALAAA